MGTCAALAAGRPSNDRRKSLQAEQLERRRVAFSAVVRAMTADRNFCPLPILMPISSLDLAIPKLRVPQGCGKASSHVGFVEEMRPRRPRADLALGWIDCNDRNGGGARCREVVGQGCGVDFWHLPCA